MIAEHLEFPSKNQISTRDGYGEGVVAAGDKDPTVVVLAADLTESTRSHWFQEKFPERFIQVGVAEQNLVTVAAGMAAAGKVPFAASYAVFSPGRNWEQIRTTICYNDLPVKIVGSHGGLSVGEDGATHQALEDIALMRVLPKMTVLVPADYIEARKATLAAADHSGPVYIRLSRAKTEAFTTGDTPFNIGQMPVFFEGGDVTIVAMGMMVYPSLIAAERLLQMGISVEVLNAVSVKPFDVDALLTSVSKTRRVVTVEEHQIAGGLGSLVSEVLSENDPVPIRKIGVQDRFGQSGEVEELFQEYGLTTEAVIETVKGVVANKDE